jgi:pre-mRNA-splicing factor ATP-dependent RNA helicase DHX15/PRP43
MAGPPGPPPGPPPAAPRDNPYLAHLPPQERGASSSAAAGSDPLAGFIPRKVTGEQARRAMDGDINPFAATPGRAFSARYRAILEKRKALPVYNQIDEFYEKFNESQIMVMIGETGSGKTTQ